MVDCHLLTNMNGCSGLQASGAIVAPAKTGMERTVNSCTEVSQAVIRETQRVRERQKAYCANSHDCAHHCYGQHPPWKPNFEQVTHSHIVRQSQYQVSVQATNYQSTATLFVTHQRTHQNNQEGGGEIKDRREGWVRGRESESKMKRARERASQRQRHRG